MALLRATLTAYVDEGPTGDTLPITAQWSSSTSAVGQIDVVDLPATTDVTLTVPTTTTLLLLIPPATNATTWVLKGNAADTGTSLRAAQPTAVGYGGGVTILRAAALISGVRVVYL